MTDHEQDPAAAEQARFERVSEQLKIGFAAMASAQLADADKPDWHRRLIAITNSSKHDLATAERRLRRFWDDWEQTTGSRPSGTQNPAT